MGAGARVRTTGTPSSRFVFGKLTSDDAFLIDPGHAGYSRSLITHMTEGYSTTQDKVFINTSLVNIALDIPGTMFTNNLRVHDGSTLSSVAFIFAVRTAHASVPEYLPRFRVARVSESGVVEPLRAPDSTTDFEGFQFFSPRPASGALWYAGSGPQTYTYTCNVNNVVDLSRYHYIIEVQDERGANSYSPSGLNGNFFSSATALCTACRVLGQRH
jgi:hypothetical protein